MRLYNAVMKGNPVVPGPEMTDEQVEELEGLGYVDLAGDEEE